MFESNNSSGGRSLFRDDDSLLTNPITWAVAAVAILGAGAAYYYTHKSDKKEVTPARVEQPKKLAPPVAAEEPAIKNPIPVPPEADKDTEPLPPLNDSDAAVTERLNQVIGQARVAEFLVPDSVVRKIVVTVDNLPRKKVAVEKRPIKSTPGLAAVTSVGESTTISDANYARYEPFIQLVQNTDTPKLIDFYFHFYPLFQQAYEDLGYPNAYFNDRVIEVIDHLLATPDVSGPIELTQPKVFYEYTDPKLEARSEGQKLLIRMGPQNAATLKKKLRDIRSQIIGRA